jgi:hypothetical protein
MGQAGSAGAHALLAAGKPARRRRPLAAYADAVQPLAVAGRNLQRLVCRGAAARVVDASAALRNPPTPVLHAAEGLERARRPERGRLAQPVRTGERADRGADPGRRAPGAPGRRRRTHRPAGGTVPGAERQQYAVRPAGQAICAPDPRGRAGGVLFLCAADGSEATGQAGALVDQHGRPGLLRRPDAVAAQHRRVRRLRHLDRHDGRAAAERTWTTAAPDAGGGPGRHRRAAGVVALHPDADPAKRGDGQAVLLDHLQAAQRHRGLERDQRVADAALPGGGAGAGRLVLFVAPRAPVLLAPAVRTGTAGAGAGRLQLPGEAGVPVAPVRVAGAAGHGAAGARRGSPASALALAGGGRHAGLVGARGARFLPAAHRGLARDAGPAGARGAAGRPGAGVSERGADADCVLHEGGCAGGLLARAFSGAGAGAALYRQFGGAEHRARRHGAGAGAGGGASARMADRAARGFV